MKQILFSSVVICIVLLSCNKQGDSAGYHGSTSITIDTTIASGSQYQLNLQPYGDADDVAAIKTQAANYTTSEIVNSASGFAPVYNFSATADAKFPLNEQVVIAVTEGNHGQNHPNNDSTIITIHFQVQ